MSYVARRAPKAFATAGPVGEMIKSTEAEGGARGCKEEKGRGEERRRGWGGEQRIRKGRRAEERREVGGEGKGAPRGKLML